MKTARALVCHDPHTFSLETVSLPQAGDDQLLVKALHSGISVGTEFALVANRISWGPYPLVTGYQAVGEVEQVGSAVRGYRPGDRVFYRANHGVMTLAGGKACSSVCGTHASHAIVTADNGVALLPANVDLHSASLFVMPAVGLHGVDKAQPRVGDVAVVIGAGLIGLGVINALANRGCRVLTVDVDDNRLALAEAFGALAVCNARKTSVPEWVAGFRAEGADVVFECTGMPDQIVPAMELCRIHGTFVYQGNYGAAPYETRFLPAHNRQLVCHYPCDDGGPECRAAVLRLMMSRSLRWDKTVTHVIGAAEAAAFYGKINRREVSGMIGGVIDWT